MKPPPYVENWAQQLVDLWFMAIPRRQPSLEALRECKIVSHRGEHDNLSVKENTIAAFDPVVESGAWGIEFDVRWTNDLQPVVIHDPTTTRLFGVDMAIAGVTLKELRRQVPEIPTLAEVVAAYGGSTHLMIELKPDALGQDEIKAARLAEILAPLKPVQDYHFLALKADRLKPAEFAAREARVLVSGTNSAAMSQQALSQNLGGLCGHYLLLNDRMARLHQSKGQKLGTGFVSSRSCFYREVTRGVDWIFSNHALRLSHIRKQLSGHR